MLSVTLLMVLAAFVTTIAHGMGRCPAWVPMLLLCIVEMLHVMPR